MIKFNLLESSFGIEESLGRLASVGSFGDLKRFWATYHWISVIEHEGFLLAWKIK